MLNGKLSLHDPRCNGHCHPGCIQDVEAFCGSILERKQIRVADREYEDTLQALIAEAWIQAGRYDQTRNTNMAYWIHLELQRFYINRLRSTYRTTWKFKDYTYTREIPQFVSYEHQFYDNGNKRESRHDTEHGELGRILTRRSLEAPEPGSTDLDRLLRSRSGVDPRRNHILGENGTREAA